MSDKEKEIIQLRKQIYHLDKTVNDLKDELEEKKVYVGQLESEHSKMKNEHLLITRTKLSQQNELIKYNVEKALEDDKEKIAFLEKNNQDLRKAIGTLELNLKGSEEEKMKLQRDNQMLKGQIDEFGKKHNVEDLTLEFQARSKLLQQKDYDYQKLVLQWNELVDKMEKVMSENSILREWANVPQNLGLPMDQIKLGEKKNIEYYKAALRRAEDEIRELEEERARLKNKLFILDSYHNAGETPFSVLTKEQQQDICEYAVALHENRQHVIPHQYELYRENDKLKMKIEILEKQLESIKIEASPVNFNRSTMYANTSNDIYREGDQREYDEQRRSQYNMANTGNMNKDFADMISGNVKKEMLEMKNYVKTTLDNYNNSNNYRGFGNIYPSSLADNFSTPIDFQGNDPNSNKGMGITSSNMGKLQMPPFPVSNLDDPANDFKVGFSNRLGNKFKVDMNQIYSIFGIVPLDASPDQLKLQAASFLTQLIEACDIVNRMKLQDQKINANLSVCNKQVEGLVLKQNYLFEKFITVKKTFSSNENKLNSDLAALSIRMEEESSRRSALEESIKLIEAKDLSALERRVLEKIKESSILEMRLLTLTRKYSSLYEEHTKLKAYNDELESSLIEKDSKTEQQLANLKEWKSMLSHYLKMMIKKMKNSVDKSEFNKIVLENNFLRDKQKELITREISASNQSNNVDYLKIKLRETEHLLLTEQELRVETQIDSFFLKNKLRMIDGEFLVMESVFNKFLVSLIQLNISIEDLGSLIETASENSNFATNNLSNINNNTSSTSPNDKKGKTTINILSMILTDILIKNEVHSHKLSLINVEFKEQEVSLLVSLLSFEDDLKEVEIELILKYIKKNSFSYSMDEDQVLFEGFLDNLKNQGNVSLITLLRAFDTLDTGFVPKEEFAFVVNSSFNPVTKYESNNTNTNNRFREDTGKVGPVKVDYSDSIISYVCKDFKDLIYSDHRSKINYLKFIEMFELRKKELAVRRKNEKFSGQLQKNFLKDNVLGSIIEKIHSSGLTVEGVISKLSLGMQNNNSSNIDKDLDLNMENKEGLKKKLTKADFIMLITDLNTGVINMKEVDFIFEFYSRKEYEEQQQDLDINKGKSGVSGKPGYNTLLKMTVQPERNSFNNVRVEKEVIDFKEFCNALKIAESKVNILKNIGTNMSEVNHNINNLNKFFNMNSMMAANNKKNNANSSSIGNKSIGGNLSGAPSYNKVLLEKSNEDKFIDFKLKQLKKEFNIVQKENKDLNSQIEDLFKKNLDLNQKFSEAKDELAKIKVEYEHGITKEEYQKLELRNEELEREVAIQKIGMSTFKDLYKSSSKQLESVSLLKEKHKDELDTYKLAIKDLQSESDAKALLGKLYYSLLVSRWRESKTIAKYDDLVNELISVKEKNFKIEADNQSYLKSIFELEESLHDKIVENVKLTDELRAHSNPIISFENYEKLNDNIRVLHKEKNDLMTCYMDLVKTHNLLTAELEEMKNIVDYYDVLAKNLKSNFTKNASIGDDYSLRIIALTDELSKYKLAASAGSRESKNLKETEAYLKRILENYETDIQRLEKENKELNTRLRKLEEFWISKDKERQNSFFEQIKIFKANRQQNEREKKNLDSETDIDSLKEKIRDLEAKVLTRDEALNKKSSELKSALENAHILKNSDPNVILNEDQKIQLQDEETRQLAQTSQKIIKTLQDMIEIKNNQILSLEQTLEHSKKEALNSKTSYIKEINELQERIGGMNNTAIDKLKSYLDTTNTTHPVKLGGNDLSKMSIKQIQELFNEQEEIVSNLSLQNKSLKEEKELLGIKIQEMSRSKADKETELILSGKNKSELIEEIQSLRFNLNKKAEEIGQLQDKINDITEKFQKRIDEKRLAFDDELLKKLDNTTGEPSRLTNNEEKSKLMSKLQQQRNQMKKMTETKEALSKENTDLKKQIEVLNQKMSSVKDTNKMYDNIVAKDTKEKSILRKNYDASKAKCEGLEKENENLKALINNMQASLDMRQKGVRKGPNTNSTNSNINTKKTVTKTSYSNPFMADENKGDKKSEKGNIEFKSEKVKVEEEDEGYGDFEASSNKGDKESKLKGPKEEAKEDIEEDIEELLKENSDKEKSISRTNDKQENKDDNIEKVLSKVQIKQPSISGSAIPGHSTKNINDGKKKTNSGAREKRQSVVVASLNNDNIVEDELSISKSNMKKLVDFCIKKNKNIHRHLKRYSTTLGKICKTDFVRAINELKLGFIEPDIISLINLCETDDIYINIEKFVKIMIECDPNYEMITREPEFNEDIHKIKNEKKYSLIEKKAFNINY
mmetsp:Transcript_25502/g.26583  ORF Transcript_25502/g.26583 Transcript_25502/m.26583 type:complete len:2300 (-) Transcript_25502:58-6957(-)